MSHPTGNKCTECGAPLDCVSITVAAVCGDCAEKQAIAAFRRTARKMDARDLIAVVAGDAWRYDCGRPELRERIKQAAIEEAVRRMEGR